MMKTLILCLLAAFGHTVAEKISYANYKVYRITPNDDGALNVLKDLERKHTKLSQFSFWNGPTIVGRSIDLMVSPTIKENIENILTSLNVDSVLTIENVQERIDAERLPALGGATDDSLNWTSYHNLDEINSWLEDLAATYPDSITLLKPGKSYEGRDVVGVRLDFGGNDTNKKAIFMEANIHAREWISAAVNTYILNELLTSEKTDVRAIAENYTWYFFPVMNPDGFEYTHTTDRLWRKTRTPYGDQCYGADPNRNWDYKWMDGGSSDNPCSETYAGPAPFSEASVNVMQKFISSVANDLMAYFDFHSYSQFMLLPYGHTSEHLDNYDEIMEIGKIGLEKLKARYGTEYIIGDIAEVIYVASGSSMDWLKGTYHTPIALSYELRDTGEYGFILPPDQIIQTAEETFDSIIAILQEYEKRHPISDR